MIKLRFFTGMGIYDNNHEMGIERLSMNPNAAPLIYDPDVSNYLD